ncbi:prophage tail fiber N-terminal domain-containing protein [Escherichia coli]|uniref:prophage tail fiber N-terminal domain-containing protein n=1 Tax=Escherichia coli TaxID=562 RepID=UPI0019D316DE|nr:prophage tail fiber N-terminal domain-containing protein [Escherichia coli]MBN6397116.1 prophage tail fiber N-terminal domain-containing protein [Escherichia coli]
MSVLISGALTDGAGIPMSGCHIILKSRVNTSEVVIRTIADVVTGNNGEYSFEAQTGKYCVYLKQDWRDEYCVGDIAVYDDSKPGTLNDFLTALDEGDLKPDVVKRFEEMVAQAQQSAEAAAGSEQQAGQYAADVQQNAEAVAEDKTQVEALASSAAQDAARAEQAKADADKIIDKAVDKLDEAATLAGEVKASAEAAAQSEQNAKSHADNAAGNAQQTAQDVTATAAARDDAERFAENARQDAAATAEDRQATAEDVKTTEENAASAAQSAQDAAAHAGTAEQAKNDIDTALSFTLKTANHLSEIATAGEAAQQESRDNLGLKEAAIMPPQTDIRDRTEGRLAIPGAFGFGKVFTRDDLLSFNSVYEFNTWGQTAEPGHYCVYTAYSNGELSGTNYGLLEVIWPYPAPVKGNKPEERTKIFIFYVTDGGMYCNRYVWNSSSGASFNGWKNMLIDKASLVSSIDNKAPLNSPKFSGTPSVPTPPLTANNTQAANTAFVRQLFEHLVDSSPESLNTLNELSKALNDDPDFAANITNMLAGKQPLNDVLTALSDLTPTVNTFPYFGANGELALAELSGRAKSLLGIGSYEKMRALMGLGGAATLEPQADIYDRTEGRLALPGAFGFGREFTTADSQVFQNMSDFSEWLKEVEPGRYAVSIADSSNLFLGTTRFNGIIDVMWAPFDNNATDVALKFKNLLCYNQFYDGEHSMHYVRYMFSGNNWNARVNYIVYDGTSLAHLLGSVTGTASYNCYQYPDIGVPILAVYRGESADDKNKRIGLGDIVSGSRLSPLVMSCRATESANTGSTPGFMASDPSYGGFPGRYKALSGSRSSSASSGDGAYACLFVRID